MIRPTAGLSDPLSGSGARRIVKRTGVRGESDKYVCTRANLGIPSSVPWPLAKCGVHEIGMLFRYLVARPAISGMRWQMRLVMVLKDSVKIDYFKEEMHKDEPLMPEQNVDILSANKLIL